MTAADFVTHYYLPNRLPFQNLSDLDEAEVLTVMDELNAMTRAGLQRRTFGRKYIAWRKLTETKLRADFIAAGGRPAREAPHYFCLGWSPWFEGLGEGMRSIVIPLGDLEPDQTSFTLIDSFSAMGFGPRFGFPAAGLPHQQRVYPLADLAVTLSKHPATAVASQDYDGFPNAIVDTFIEVQVWHDAPIRQHLSHS